MSAVVRRGVASPAVAVTALVLALVATGCAAVPEQSSSPSPSGASGTPSPSETSTPLRTTTPPAVTSPPSTSSTPSAPSAASPAFAFVVGGEATYSEAHHDYPATDVFADCGAEVRAPFAGTVAAVSTRDVWSGSTNRGQDRGGLSVTVDAAPGAAGGAVASGVRFYGSHLARLDVAVGDRVTAGQRLGLVGRTGSAAGTPCHLHVGLSPARCSPQEWWTRRGVVSPYPYLRSWEQGERLDPAAEVAEWWSRHGCPREP